MYQRRREIRKYFEPNENENKTSKFGKEEVENYKGSKHYRDYDDVFTVMSIRQNLMIHTCICLYMYN